jgi:hypothetical protein
MMIEFEDHDEEEQRLLLRYLDNAMPKPAIPARPNWFWRLIGRIYLAYARWRYRAPRH